MSAFSNLLSNVSSGLKNLGTAASNIGTTFGPIVSAFNPAAGTVLSQIGQVGQAVAGQPKAPTNNVVMQAQYQAQVMPAGYAPSSFDTGASFFTRYKMPLMIGGGVAALLLVVYVMKG